MMLTTVNMPAVTAWAQDDKAGTAEIAADETKTPVSAEMTTTKTVFPYGEEAGLGPALRQRRLNHFRSEKTGHV